MGTCIACLLFLSWFMLMLVLLCSFLGGSFIKRLVCVVCFACLLGLFWWLACVLFECLVRWVCEDGGCVPRWSVGSVCCGLGVLVCCLCVRLFVEHVVGVPFWCVIVACIRSSMLCACISSGCLPSFVQWVCFWVVWLLCLLGYAYGPGWKPRRLLLRWACSFLGWVCISFSTWGLVFRRAGGRHLVACILHVSFASLGFGFRRTCGR